MNVHANDFEIRDKGANPPAHFAKWGWGEAEWDRFQAQWSLAAERRLSSEGSPIRGCPLGTGKTEAAAREDLIRRTNAESRIKLRLA
ncbi:MAG: hypothetical protein AB7L09_01880 [Nitrospira sp.]